MIVESEDEGRTSANSNENSPMDESEAVNEVRERFRKPIGQSSPVLNRKKRNNSHSINQVAQKLCQQLSSTIVRDIDCQLKLSIENAVDRILERSEMSELSQPLNWMNSNMSDKMQKSTSDLWLPEKTFLHRNSVLTDLFKISHIQTVYHIFVAILIIFSMNTMLSDILEKGGIAQTYHFDLFVWLFRGLYSVFFCWMGMFLSTIFVVYLIFIIWCTKRPSQAAVYPFDWCFLSIYIFYQCLFAMLPVVFIYKYNLAPASTLIVSMEQVRMIMKSHAFVRSTAKLAFSPLEIDDNKTKAINHQKDSLERFPATPLGDISQSIDEELKMSNGNACPSFANYFYFLFAPTLVYRSSYPRTPYIRWRLVAVNFLQVGLCIIYVYYIFARFCFSYFADFGRSRNFQFSLRQLVISSFGCMLPGALVLLITFYAFLHCWLNAFAEMLRFGDRLFYKDWWNSINFSAYYRSWNVVVHDWLYTYIYRDVYAICKRRRRATAQTAVFFLSALVHEYVLIVVFKFFYPVLFVIFGVAGFAIAHIKGRSRLWNIGIWTGLFMGMGILMCLYSMEWYARKNCPSTPGGLFVDTFVPRSWFCYNNTLSL